MLLFSKIHSMRSYKYLYLLTILAVPSSGKGAAGPSRGKGAAGPSTGKGAAHPIAFQPQPKPKQPAYPPPGKGGPRLVRRLEKSSNVQNIINHTSKKRNNWVFLILSMLLVLLRSWPLLMCFNNVVSLSMLLWLLLLPGLTQGSLRDS